MARRPIGSGYRICDSPAQYIADQYAFAYAGSGDIDRPEATGPASHLYRFILDVETMGVAAHGGGPELAADTLGLTGADRGAAEILADLESSRGARSEHTAANPETGERENGRSWLAMLEGYVFAGCCDPDPG